MDAPFVSQRKHKIMDDDEESLGSVSSLSQNSIESSSSESTEDTASSRSSSSSSSSSPTSSCKGPSFEIMSSPKEQLPFKRGLSMHYQGKSQSFTSLSNIISFQDLAKPERPLKKLKSSKSCGEGLGNKKSIPSKCFSERTITNKAPRASFASSSFVTAQRNCLLGISKPPLHPHI